MQHGLLSQSLAQLAGGFLQPGELRDGSFDLLRGGAGLLEVESTFEHAFGIPADRRELGTQVANIRDGFGGHRTLPADSADARSVGSPGSATL
jgi:hypothetical protein